MSGQRQVYWNGEFINESEAKLSIYDSALMFGDMVFEMTRSFNKKQFKLREHIERLFASARYVSMDIPMTVEQVVEAAEETIRRNDALFLPEDEHRLMINMTRGTLSIYQEVLGGHKGTNVIIADFPLRWTVSGMSKLFDEGVEAVIPNQRTVPASLIDPKVKNRSRLHYLLANVEVSRYKGRNAWALLLDPDGFIAEGTGANFFIVKDGDIITPEPRNVLRGISRAYVMEELAPVMKVKCIERNIEPYDALNADEAFYTATPFCMLPVTAVNGRTLGTGKMGPITRGLMDIWGRNEGVDIIGQIRKWDEARKGGTKGPSPYSFGKAEEK